MKALKWTAGLAAVGLLNTAMAESGPTYLVAGSNEKDFSITCEKQGKMTLSVRDRNGIDNMQVARNIYVTDQGGGRTLLTFKHGFSNASEDGTHLTATNETCTFLEQ